MEARRRVELKYFGSSLVEVVMVSQSQTWEVRLDEESDVGASKVQYDGSRLDCPAG